MTHHDLSLDKETLKELEPPGGVRGGVTYATQVCPTVQPIMATLNCVVASGQCVSAGCPTNGVASVVCSAYC